MRTTHADTVAAIRMAIHNRASREALWHMPLYDVDLEAMAEEIAEALAQYDGTSAL